MEEGGVGATEPESDNRIRDPGEKKMLRFLVDETNPTGVPRKYASAKLASPTEFPTLHQSVNPLYYLLKSRIGVKS
jgi:hypothetical protein